MAGLAFVVIVFVIDGISNSNTVHAVFLFGSVLLGLYLWKKRMERQFEKSKVSCTNCECSIYPSAPQCYNCGTVQQSLYQIGVFGQPTNKVVSNRTAHTLQLRMKKHCPICATRLKQKTIRQTCSVCSTETFASADDVQEYLSALRPHLMRTTVVCFVFSTIPLLGLVPGIIYYRLSLISGLRCYVPRHVGCAIRWGVWLLNLQLIFFQPFPFLGAITLPLMCLSNYYIYQKIIERESQREFGSIKTVKGLLFDNLV